MSNQDQSPNNSGNSTGVIEKVKPKTKKPSMYKVIMLNDDYTPMEFVVHILERFFSKTREEATKIMLHVHQQGVGICGVFSYEIAEPKMAPMACASFVVSVSLITPLISYSRSTEGSNLWKLCMVSFLS